MLRYFSRTPISTRLWLLVGLFSLLVLADTLAEMAQHGRRLRLEKELKLEQLVETTYSILSHYQGQVQAGLLSDTEARRLAVDAIRPLRYGNGDYYWIHDLGQPVPRMVMHPTVPSLDNTVLDAPNFLRATSFRRGSHGPYHSLQGSNLFVAMNQAVQSEHGKGFVTYEWPKPIASGGVTTELYPKLSFVKRFQPWGWVIGSGIYMDEFEAEYWRNLQHNLATAVVWLLLFGLMVWIILRTIVRPLHALQNSFDSVRNNPQAQVELPKDQPAELERLGQSFESLMLELQRSRQDQQASLDKLSLAACAFAEMSEGVVVTDTQGRIESINPAFTRISGYTSAEAVGQTPALLKSGRHPKEFYEVMWQELKRTGTWSGEVWNRARDGHIFTEWLSISTAHDNAGQQRHYVGVFSDITERKRIEADLRVAATAFESQEGMFITDANGVIMRVNLAFNNITGYTSEEAVGKTPRLLKSGRHDEAFYAAMRDCLERTDAWQGEIWNRRKNGEIFPEWLTITAVRDSEGNITHHVSTLTDITLRKAAESEIRQLAFYDPLTQLPNRRLLLDRLAHALSASARRKRPGALLFIDLDNFKTLNDTLGHNTGDLLLQEVAKRLTDCVRDTDTVARLGGDEFVIVLEDLNEPLQEAAKQVQLIGEKVLATLNQNYDLAGNEHHNSPSIGVTLFEGNQYSIEDLLKRADLAMYQAKSAGRNTVRFFDPEMQSIVKAKAMLEADLREALRLNQLFLHYQAQVDRNGDLVGAEALLRWKHPVRGMVSPAQFIPLAEETGLILPLGQWVMEQACRQLVSWGSDPVLAHVCLAINVSAVQYRQADFVESVLAILDATGVDPSKLKLELTESVLLDNVEDIIAKMAALRSRGIQFSLDDFGTGYSSLSYLKRLPLDQLKIDQSFVRDLLSDPNDAAIVKTIVSLAGNLGLAVIAEGVETDAQRICLSSQGCFHYQGYFFGRPGPAENLRALVLRQQPPLSR